MDLKYILAMWECTQHQNICIEMLQMQNWKIGYDRPLTRCAVLIPLFSTFGVPKTLYGIVSHVIAELRKSLEKTHWQSALFTRGVYYRSTHLMLWWACCCQGYLTRNLRCPLPASVLSPRHCNYLEREQCQLKTSRLRCQVRFSVCYGRGDIVCFMEDSLW